jgi:transposase
MPDVISMAPAQVARWVALDVHKLSIVAATLPSHGGAPDVVEIDNTERAVRRLIARLGGSEGLAVCYADGPCGYDLLRLLAAIGVACDLVAPSLVPVRAGDRVKTDRRDAKKLVRLYRAGALSFVAPPTPEQEGLRDLVRCRDDLVCARRAARHRVVKQLLRYGRIYREGRKSWTLRHRAWWRASGWTIRWPSARLSTCALIWTASTRRSPLSTASLTESPPASRGAIPFAG